MLQPSGRYSTPLKSSIWNVVAKQCYISNLYARELATETMNLEPHEYTWAHHIVICEMEAILGLPIEGGRRNRF